MAPLILLVRRMKNSWRLRQYDACRAVLRFGTAHTLVVMLRSRRTKLIWLLLVIISNNFKIRRLARQAKRTLQRPRPRSLQAADTTEASLSKLRAAVNHLRKEEIMYMQLEPGKRHRHARVRVTHQPWLDSIHE